MWTPCTTSGTAMPTRRRPSAAPMCRRPRWPWPRV
jgi:hypothetical protein